MPTWLADLKSSFKCIRTEFFVGFWDLDYDLQYFPAGREGGEEAKGVKLGGY